MLDFFPFSAVPISWPQPQDTAVSCTEGPWAHSHEARGQCTLQLLCTNACWRAGLPEESVFNLHTADLGASLQCIARITLEHRGVTGFPAVAAPAPILWDPRVIAGCCCGHWDKKTRRREAASVSSSQLPAHNLHRPPSLEHCHDHCHFLVLSSLWQEYHCSPLPYCPSAPGSYCIIVSTSSSH